MDIKQIKYDLRIRRSTECFPVINRGKLWYDRLSREQLAELRTWYQAWLDAPKTLIAPEPLEWTNKKLELEEIL